MRVLRRTCSVRRGHCYINNGAVMVARLVIYAFADAHVAAEVVLSLGILFYLCARVRGCGGWGAG